MNKNSSNRLAPDWYQMGITEYIVLANPDKKVYDIVMLEKESFQDKYDADIATKTLPHITLANVLAKKGLESLLCSCVKRICSVQHSFTVALKFRWISATYHLRQRSALRVF